DEETAVFLTQRRVADEAGARIHVRSVLSCAATSTSPAGVLAAFRRGRYSLPQGRRAREPAEWAACCPNGGVMMETVALLGTTMGLGFVAGINLYATVLAIGLGVQLGLITLPSHLAGLAVLGHPLVVVAAGLCYTVEFFADKVPWVDSVWDVIH